MTLLAVGLAVVVLVLLIAALRTPPLIAFVISAVTAAILLGMPLATVPTTIEKGIGEMLGSIVAIVVLGAAFGKLIADSGAAQQIAETLMSLLGSSRIPVAMAATGFLVGIPLFYNVGFVLMVPLIFSVVYRSGLPAVQVGMPMLAGLSIAHGFLPPHPSPTALVLQFRADTGLTLVYGLIVGLPTLAIAGPMFASTLKKIETPPSALFAAEPRDRSLPGAIRSFTCALLPVLLISGSTLLATLHLLPQMHTATVFAGNPMVALLATILISMALLSRASGMGRRAMMDGFAVAIRDIAPIILIIGGAGALKQVLIESGADHSIAAGLASLPLSLLVLGWLLACVIRIALGSATVAGLTAAGMMKPVIAATGANANLMVLAVGAGSLMCSHVNDSGFWMFKEYFQLSIRDTFRSWSLMETLVGSFGLYLFSCLVRSSERKLGEVTFNAAPSVAAHGSGRSRGGFAAEPSGRPARRRRQPVRQWL
ncbi:GntP family permease [Sphingomonas sp. BAUL-RG-20F-R05-02]|uniref:GntP family permease n=1 Tax=Sphingomonas sp. BAUL-RG-20F-R05-02 TaxID=2914830 RepID=UPI001F5A9267|nr:gluconate:H+ symporter [Sphingomonas sp. BAUL-RG-20F-R05-02]